MLMIMYKFAIYAMVPGSSAVEQATVNRLAGGSNPSRGAKIFFYMLALIPDNPIFSEGFQATGLFRGVIANKNQYVVSCTENLCEIVKSRCC